MSKSVVCTEVKKMRASVSSEHHASALPDHDPPLRPLHIHGPQKDSLQRLHFKWDTVTDKRTAPLLIIALHTHWGPFGFEEQAEKNVSLFKCKNDPCILKRCKNGQYSHNVLKRKDYTRINCWSMLTHLLFKTLVRWQSHEKFIKHQGSNKDYWF